MHERSEQERLQSTISKIREVVAEIIPLRILWNYDDSQSNLLQAIREFIKGEKVHFSEEELKEIILYTGGQCLANTQAVALEILNNNALRRRFSDMYFLQGFQTDTERFVENIGYNHAYLVLYDKETMLYAAISPSNYKNPQPQGRNRLSEVIVGDSLSDVVKKVSELDGGVWPDPNFDIKKLDYSPSWFVPHPALLKINPDIFK